MLSPIVNCQLKLSASLSFNFCLTKRGRQADLHTAHATNHRSIMSLRGVDKDPPPKEEEARSCSVIKVDVEVKSM